MSPARDNLMLEREIEVDVVRHFALYDVIHVISAFIRIMDRTRANRKRRIREVTVSKTWSRRRGPQARKVVHGAPNLIVSGSVDDFR